MKKFYVLMLSMLVFGQSGAENAGQNVQNEKAAKVNKQELVNKAEKKSKFSLIKRDLCIVGAGLAAYAAGIHTYTFSRPQVPDSIQSLWNYYTLPRQCSYELTSLNSLKNDFGNIDNNLSCVACKKKLSANISTCFAVRCAYESAKKLVICHDCANHGFAVCPCDNTAFIKKIKQCTYAIVKNLFLNKAVNKTDAQLSRMRCTMCNHNLNVADKLQKCCVVECSYGQVNKSIICGDCVGKHGTSTCLCDNKNFADNTTYCSYEFVSRSFLNAEIGKTDGEISHLHCATCSDRLVFKNPSEQCFVIRCGHGKGNKSVLCKNCAKEKLFACPCGNDLNKKQSWQTPVCGLCKVKMKPQQGGAVKYHACKLGTIEVHKDCLNNYRLNKGNRCCPWCNAVDTGTGIRNENNQFFSY